MLLLSIGQRFSCSQKLDCFSILREECFCAFLTRQNLVGSSCAPLITVATGNLFAAFCQSYCVIYVCSCNHRWLGFVCRFSLHLGCVDDSEVPFPKAACGRAPTLSLSWITASGGGHCSAMQQRSFRSRLSALAPGFYFHNVVRTGLTLSCRANPNVTGAFAKFRQVRCPQVAHSGLNPANELR